jgi:hypothetical protein
MSRKKMRETATITPCDGTHAMSLMRCGVVEDVSTLGSVENGRLSHPVPLRSRPSQQESYVTPRCARRQGSQPLREDRVKGPKAPSGTPS